MVELQAEVRRLRARIGQLERSQRGWSEVMRQLLFNTLLEQSKEEALRTRCVQREGRGREREEEREKERKREEREG